MSELIKKSILQKRDFPMDIGFWSNNEGTLALTHKEGLTSEQLAFFHNLKLGDRLAIWDNGGKSANAPHLNLKLFVPKKNTI
jgi:hypothetical protein